MKSTMKSFLGRIAACAAVALTATGAYADTYNFALTGDYTANWQLTSSPTPDDKEDDTAFVLSNVPGTFTGASTGVVDLYFWNADVGSGLEIHDLAAGDVVLFSSISDQLYTGTEASPTFKLGSFAMTEFGGTDTYTLTVTNVSAVPEPESYALLLAGLGAMGAVVARRRKV